MKKRGYIIGAVALALMSAGCSSTYFASAGYGGDDLYAVHDKAAIARRQQAEAEAKKAEAEARKAEWEARLAEAEANAVQRRYYDATASSNPYEEVLADTYESAYARRLRGFESPTYRLPSSYYDFRYGTSFSYVSAYDPAFYNVMVMGDQVWVEPKYITAMFGSWGRPSFYADPWYYGWNTYRPYYGWGLSFGRWGWGFGWYDPWYYPGWSWGYPGWPGHPHWGGGHGHRPHRPYASNIVHRANPNASPSGGRYYRSNLRFDAPVSGGGTSYRNSSNRTGDFGVRNSSGSNRGSGSSAAPARSNTGSNRNTGTYDRNNRGSNNYDRGSSNNSGSNNRSSNSNWSNSSNSSGSYNRGSSTGGSYNRGGSGGGSSRNAGGR